MKFYQYIAILLIVVMAHTACNDFLDQKPSKTSSLVINSIEHLEFLLNSYSDFYREENRTAIYSSDDFGLIMDLYDAYSIAYEIDGVQFATWDIDYLPFDAREYFWDEEYHKIFIANLVLSNLPKVSGTDAEKEKISNEAHLIRAYSMWNLAQTYCLPYTEINASEPGMVLKQSTSFEEPVDRASLKETYDFIESDLEEALKLTNKMEFVNNKFSSWRGSKAAANAFAARFYLNRNNYDKALEHANIALQEHNVMMDYNSDMRYSDILTNVNIDGKSIPVLYPYTHDNYIDLTDILEWKELYYFRMLSHEAWWYIPSQELLALYDHDYDLRYKYHIVEYYSYTRGVINPPYEYPGYIFFFKDQIPSGPTVAEIMLIKAECLARQDKVSEAMAAVNQLRAKRMDKNAPDSVINLSAENKSDAIKVILEERRREMPFTQRWFDIRRLNNNEDALDDIPILTRTFYSYNNSNINPLAGKKKFTLEKGSRRFAAPIPNTEVESSNGVIVQNTY